MLKFILGFTLLMTAGLSFASPIEHTMSMKERLRLSLWIEGIQPQSKVKATPSNKRPLPEELERALRKL